MRNLTSLLAVTFAGMGFLATAPAQAVTITFDEPAVSGIVDQQPVYSFNDQGYHFSASEGYMAVWDGSSPNSNGTQNLISAGGDTVTITKVGGGAFNFNSLQMAISWYGANPTETISINNTPITLTQSLQTFGVDLHGVTSVSITTFAGGYWTADNMNITPDTPKLSTGGNGGVGGVTAVPELSTWTMMFAGFAGLGFAGYRRRQASALA